MCEGKPLKVSELKGTRLDVYFWEIIVINLVTQTVNNWALGLAWYRFFALFCRPSYTQVQKFLDSSVNRYLIGSEECLSTGAIWYRRGDKTFGAYQHKIERAQEPGLLQRCLNSPPCRHAIRTVTGTFTHFSLLLLLKDNSSGKKARTMPKPSQR